MNVLDKLIAERGLSLSSPSQSAQPAQSEGPSLDEMASGGFNHAQLWMNPGLTSRFQGQAPVQRSFSSQEDDSPPGAPPYASGPLAIPRPQPSPKPQSFDPNLLKRFSWSSAFEEQTP